MIGKDLISRGWSQTTFSNICKKIIRGPFGSSLKKTYFVPHGFKVYEQQNAIKKDYMLGHYYIDEKKFQELKRFAVSQGEYIISCSGTIGRLYRLPKTAPQGVINQALLKITLESKLINHSFFSYLFQSKLFLNYILSDTRGTGMENLSGVKEIKLVPILVPPVSEQRKIVEVLDLLIAQLDNGIANLKAAKDKLEIYRQAVLKKVFEGKWSRCTIGERFDFVGGGTPSKSEPDYWYGEIPWCSVKDVKNKFLLKTKEHITALGVKESATNIAEPGMVILITRISPGKSTITKIKTAINQDLKIVIPKVNYGSKYIHYLLKSIERTCIKKSSGTTVLGINLNNLKSIEIPDIPINEHEKIVSFIETRFSVCDNIQASIEEGLKKAEALRQSILKKAFEGRLLSEKELEACRKELDWEPADKLLERIKKSKEEDS